MKKGKSSEKRSHSQASGRTPEKGRKSSSYTQGDRIPEDIDEVLANITLKKPKRAYNFYIAEMMDKDNVKSLPEATTLYSKKWKKMSASERAKYDEMAEEDKKRYETDLGTVRKFVLQKPLKEGATSYRIFLEERLKKAAENEEDIKEAKKEASEKWKNMTAEEKKEFNEKKKEHQAHYEELKKAKNVANPYNVFVEEQAKRARGKGEKITFQDIADAWKKTKQSVKDKYQEIADDINRERKDQRDIYEIALGVKPKRPVGAYKFFMMEAAKDGKFEGKNPFREGTKMWKKLSNDEKEKYQKMAHRERLAYMMKKMEFQSQIKKQSSTRPLSAFNLYVQDHKGEKAPKGKTFFDHLYKKWEKLDDSTKRKYLKKAEEEKEHSEKRKEEVKSRKYDQPKRPVNAYNFYIKNVLPELRKENPKKETKDLFSIAAKQWGDLSDKDKSKYVKMFEKESDRYDQLMKEFEETGFYTPDKTQRSQRSESNKRSKSRASSGSKSKKSKGKSGKE
jgi:hypothetical protein